MRASTSVVAPPAAKMSAACIPGLTPKKVITWSGRRALSSVLSAAGRSDELIASVTYLGICESGTALACSTLVGSAALERRGDMEIIAAKAAQPAGTV